MRTLVYFKEIKVKLFCHSHFKMAATVSILFVKSSKKRRAKFKLPPLACSSNGQIILFVRVCSFF